MVISTAGDGRNEDDLVVILEWRGPSGEFAVDSGAETFKGRREAVAGAEFVVEFGGVGCGGGCGIGGIDPGCGKDEAENDHF